MRRRIIGSSCAAALLAFAVAATGQTSSQTPTQSPVQSNTSQTTPTSQRSSTSPRTATEQNVTLTGCVMKVPGSSSSVAGANNTFMLSNATASNETAHPSANGSTASTSTAEAGATTPSPRTGSTTTGISGQGNGMSYMLEGTQASNLSQYVGQRVEVVGHIEGGAVGTSGTATGAAGAPAATSGTNDPHEGPQTKTGTSGTAMPRVTVSSVRPMTGSCL